jgi:hypothetical protein
MRHWTVILAGVLFLSFGFPGDGSALDILADMISKEGKVTRNGKIYVKGEMCRIEKGMTPIYMILRGDKGLLWQVNAAERTYVEARLGPESKPAIEEKIFGETARKDLGTESVNGYAAKKCEVTLKRGNKTETWLQWFAADVGFPAKVAAKDGSWSVEYRNITKGSPSDELFEVPPGLARDTLEVPDVLH